MSQVGVQRSGLLNSELRDIFIKLRNVLQLTNSEFRRTMHIVYRLKATFSNEAGS